MEQRKDWRKNLPEIPKTAEGLRDALFDEINWLRQGRVDVTHARSLANLVRQCIDAARLGAQIESTLSEKAKRITR